jgi:hypothetical protein
MKTKLSIGMGLALVLGACASTPQPNAALETARTAVQSAEADPNVSKYAALDLESAKKDLDAPQGRLDCTAGVSRHTDGPPRAGPRVRQGG